MDSFRFGLFVTTLVLGQCRFSCTSKTMSQAIIPPTLSTAEDFNNHLDGYLTSSNNLALFLDYDGTLSPITDHPERAVMAEETRSTLQALANNPKIFLGVISGRGLGDIKSKVGIANITYGGNHGYEIENADQTRSDFQLPQDVKDNYRKLVTEMTNKYTVEGAWVEDKKVSLTFHYRDTPSVTPEVLQGVVQMIKDYGFRANEAINAIEAKPPINWNKGEAALLIMKKNFGDDWRSTIKVITAGDDTTDEDLMKAFKEGGRTFRVSTNPEIETNAHFRLPSTQQVTLLLKWIEKQYK